MAMNTRVVSVSGRTAYLTISRPTSVAEAPSTQGSDAPTDHCWRTSAPFLSIAAWSS